MNFPKPEAITNTSAWLTKDPEWVQMRKASWRDLAHRGFGKRGLEASRIKALETYYMTGKNRVPTKWGKHEHPSMPLLFRLWFHPDQSEANWQAQTAATIWRDYDISVRELQFLCDDNGPGVSGLEERLYDLLLGGKSTRSFLLGGEYSQGRTVYEERSIEQYRFGPILPISELELVLEVPGKNPHVLGRYGIRHWLVDPLHPSWTKVFDEPTNFFWLDRLFHLVRFRAAPEGKDSSTPEQIELAHELCDLFDQGGGPERFQQEWQERAKSDAWKTAPPERV